jgi:hypothetical protein
MYFIIEVYNTVVFDYIAHVTSDFASMLEDDAVLDDDFVRSAAAGGRKRPRPDLPGLQVSFCRHVLYDAYTCVACFLCVIMRHVVTWGAKRRWNTSVLAQKAQVGQRVPHSMPICVYMFYISY